MASPMAPERRLEFHLGDRLRKAREDGTGLDRKAFAAVIGIHPNSARAYETGRTVPRPPVVTAWALATGYSVDELRGGGTAPPGGPGASVPVGAETGPVLDSEVTER